MNLRARLKALEGTTSNSGLIGLAERLRRHLQWMRDNPFVGPPIPESEPMLRRRLNQLDPGSLAHKMGAQRLWRLTCGVAP
jgi:hypothetical protein